MIFLVKENHTFDNYFGKYPGADGATRGKTLQCDQGNTPGPTVKLTPAPYIYPHDLGHAFVPGLTAIDGGRMDGFNCVPLGDDMTGYTQFSRKTLPAYWALADRFVLADHFFTSMYGPTFPEHLYTVAAQSYGIVDNKSSTDHPGQLLRRPDGVHEPVPDRGPVEQGHPHDHEPRGPLPRRPGEPVPDRGRIGCTRRRASTSRCCPTSSRRRT